MTDAPSLENVGAWAGYRLDGLGGGKVGRIEGAYADAKSGRPEWLLARTGRLGRRRLVPARDAVAGAGRVWVPYARDLIRRAPKARPKADLNGAREAELLAHYGIDVDAGRGAEIRDDDAEAVTARRV
jgi:hypothetical protein